MQSTVQYVILDRDGLVKIYLTLYCAADAAFRAEQIKVAIPRAAPRGTNNNKKKGQMSFN